MAIIANFRQPLDYMKENGIRFIVDSICLCLLVYFAVAQIFWMAAISIEYHCCIAGEMGCIVRPTYLF